MVPVVRLWLVEVVKVMTPPLQDVPELSATGGTRGVVAYVLAELEHVAAVDPWVTPLASTATWFSLFGSFLDELYCMSISTPNLGVGRFPSLLFSQPMRLEEEDEPQSAPVTVPPEDDGPGLLDFGTLKVVKLGVALS
jgi:hypothetical protein